MALQEEDPTAQRVHAGPRSRSTATGDAEVVPRHQRAPWLYCYPRVRAHSNLLTCCSAAEGAGIVWPQRLHNAVSAYTSILTSSVRNKNTNVEKMEDSKNNKMPVDEQLVQTVYPHAKIPLVSGSTVGMVESVLEHICMPQGGIVFLPGLLLPSHFQLLELFDLRQLRVVGYDVDFVTMRIDEEDLKRKASNLGAIGITKKSIARHGCCCALLLLIGIGGRFAVNADTVVSFARTELSAMTLELHPITAASLSYCGPGSGLAPLHADIHITCMDAPGEFGGAVAFAEDPLLARGIQVNLEKRPPAEAQRHWVALAQHVAHLMISDGMSFQVALRGMQWWCSLARVRSEAKLKVGADDDAADTSVVASDRIFQLLMAPRANAVRSTYALVSESVGSTHNKLETESAGGSSNAEAVQRESTDGRVSFSRPHKGVIKWMMKSVLDMQRRIELECFSLWEFISRMRNDVEIVSAGEPDTPWRCVLGFSDGLILRVRSPTLAAQALRKKGFDAAAAMACTWGSKGGNDRADLARKRPSSLTLREVVSLPECPKCEELARHALFIPLLPEMKQKNRDKIFYVMQTTLSSSLFSSPSRDFQQHVMSTPLKHAYRSAAADAIFASWKQRHRDGKTFFADPQPLLLWCLLGPVPGYLLSKL